MTLLISAYTMGLILPLLSLECSPGSLQSHGSAI